MSELRRMFEMPEEDTECLDAMGLEWETVIESNARWLIFPTYPIPDACNVPAASAAIRIKPSYPDEDIDMVFFSPPLNLKSGKFIRQLSETTIDGKTYQQWSRHRTPDNPWRIGLDNACTHMLQVDQWLEREIG
jgi:hypothetical protein